MTSLTPFMNASRAVAAERKAEALARVVSMLLQGMALHCFESDSASAENFQTSIRKVRSDFEKVDDPDTALLLAGAAIRLMEDYNESVQRQAREKQIELESAIALLSEGLLEVSHAETVTAVEIREIERDLAAANDVEALRRAKERLTDTVVAIRHEASNPLTRSDVPHGELDTATGLPDYGFAAGAIAEIWQRRDRYFAAIFSAERLETINLRFGFQAGDQVLSLLSRHVGKILGPGDRLFRWRGPCVMALIRRDMPEAFVASDLARHALAKLEHAITLGEREVMMAVSTSWTLFPLRTAGGIEELLGQMNTFAAGRMPARKAASVSNARA